MDNDTRTLVLGIETTCDETAASVVERSGDGAGRILSNIVRSQTEEHAAFGGVVPEIAARAHVELLDGIVAAAMFSFIQSFENLDLSMLLVGPGRITLPVAMLNYLEFRIDPTLAAVATVQITLVGILMVVTDRFVKLSRVV